jgi:starch phosphorylase
MTPGAEDIVRAASALASRLPWPLGVLARLAYNYRWAWLPDGPDVFEDVDQDRWILCGRNPVRLLQETSAEALLRAAGDSSLVARAEQLEALLLEDLARPTATDVASDDRPIAFFCAEYGLHVSLPIYAGGLGALAGDILKQASDRALPLVAVGLMYRHGYFRQRVDHTGWQQEFWVPTDPERSPAVLVTAGDDRRPLRIHVPIGADEVVAQVWRVDVGRVPPPRRSRASRRARSAAAGCGRGRTRRAAGAARSARPTARPPGWRRSARTSPDRRRASTSPRRGGDRAGAASARPPRSGRGRRW